MYFCFCSERNWKIFLDFVFLRENCRCQVNISWKKGHNKDRTGKELTEAEEIKKRRQEYTEQYMKDLNDPENHDGVVTHLEPDILECEVKWALGRITINKASEGDGIPAKLFKILKRWCCESAALSMPANLENSAVATGLEKVSFHSSPQRKFKLLHSCTHFTR